MISQFGSLVAGWRRAYDPDSDGKLQFSEFCRISKSIGYTGYLKQVWQGLDDDNTGFVSLEELDPEGSKALHEFGKLVEEAYGTLEDAWEKHIDPDGSGKAFVSDIARICKELKYTAAKPSTLYKYLDLSGEGSIDQSELEFLKIARRKKQEMTARELLEAEREKQRQKNEVVLEEFRKFLCNRFGNVVVGWRRHLDPDGDGRLNFSEFCKSCRNLGFTANLKALWNALDTDDSKYVSLNELDPDGVKMINAFKDIVLVFFNSAEEAWHSTLDTDGSGRCVFEEFDAACRRMHLKADRKKLFFMMDASGTGEITFDEFELMELPKAEDPVKAKRFARDSQEKTLLRAEAFFEKKFENNLTRAWRWGLCDSEVPVADHFSHAISAKHFCDVCRRLGFHGNLLVLWEALTSRGVDNPTPTLSLCQWYPKGFKELSQFRNLLAAEFGCLEQAVFHLLENTPVGRLNRAFFPGALDRLNISFDALRVFDAVIKNTTSELVIADLECLKIHDEGFGYETGDLQKKAMVRKCLDLADAEDPNRAFNDGWKVLQERTFLSST